VVRHIGLDDIHAAGSRYLNPDHATPAQSVRKHDDPRAQLARAMALHQAGRLDEARTSYRTFLKRYPDHAEALHLHGLVHLQRGETEKGLPLLEKALRIRPEFADAHLNLGIALIELNRLEAARVCIEKCLVLQPGSAEAHYNLGAVHHRMKRNDTAAACYARALELKPDYAAAHNNLGLVLHSSGRRVEAIACYAQALRLRPGDANAHNNLGDTLCALGRHAEAVPHYAQALALRPGHAQVHDNIGVALQILSRHEEAVACHEAALRLKPDFIAAHIHLGNALDALDRHDQALACFARALRLDPGCAEAHVYVGNLLLQKLNRAEAAVASYEQALRLRPDYVDAHYNLGVAKEALNRPREAVAHHEQALACDPGCVKAAQNRAYLYLLLGRFEHGWPLYEQRWSAPTERIVVRDYPRPRWQGEYVQGVLLAWGEQGLGDQIMYAGMLRELQSHADAVVIEVEPRLAPLFARSFPGIQVMALASELYPGTVDAQVPLGSLCGLLRRGWEAFAHSRPGYLCADADRVAKLRARLKPDGRPLIGLSWSSSNPRLSKFKNAQLRDFEPLLRRSDCRFVDLQYGDTAAQRATLVREFAVRIEHLEEVDNTNDVDALAALITACDRVVTVSNTTAHLAAALGRPTAILLPHGLGRHWYWFEGRSDSPWYPCATLYRQRTAGDWAGILTELAESMGGAERRE
jgi:tetratricopeptide (TPR) repeat protein